MQLLISPGFYSPELTAAFLQSLCSVVTPERLWVLPACLFAEGFSKASSNYQQILQYDQPLHIIAFSAGVVAAYPIALTWQAMGGISHMIAMDGWGMPLLGNFRVHRLSHDRWTHDTTYFPSASESAGAFYADPAVDHLTLWQSPNAAQGRGEIGGIWQSMTALEFIVAALQDEAFTSAT